MRFTLSKLFLAVAMAALACAGMTLRTRWWAESILAVTILLFVVVAIRAIGQRGKERAFAVAFSAVGLGYLLLLSSNLCEALITNLPLAASARAMQIPLNMVVPTTIPFGSPFRTYTNGSDANDSLIDMQVTAQPLPFSTLDDYVRVASRPDSSGSLGAFFLVGHCVWSWLFALLAGWFAASIYAKREAFQKA